MFEIVSYALLIMMSYDEINVDIWSLQPEEVITIQNVGSKKCDQSKFYVY